MDDPVDMRIKTSATETAQRVAPWRPDIAWWIVGIQGLVVLALGLWLLFNQGAGEPVLAVTGLLVLLIAAIQAWSAMRSELPQVVLGWRGLRAGVGLMTGALVFIDFWLDFLTLPAALAVLALGLVIAGLLGIVEWLVGREAMGWRWPTLAGPVVYAAFGVVVLASRLQAAPLFLQVIAVAGVVIGALLLLRAGTLFREERLRRDTGGLPAASSSATAVPQAGAGTSAPAVTVRSAGSGSGPDDGTPAS